MNANLILGVMFFIASLSKAALIALSAKSGDSYILLLMSLFADSVLSIVCLRDAGKKS